ncbi:MAG TPA: hypothetical protein PKK43_06875, partial [Spirochaetota bacterium]|nr:hypothetical protein [Spirochaetota bacterium]
SFPEIFGLKPDISKKRVAEILGKPLFISNDFGLYLSQGASGLCEEPDLIKVYYNNGLLSGFIVIYHPGPSC